MARALLGLPCPGCGSTRALIALFSGNVRQYFDYMPLAVPNVFLLLYFIFSYPRKKAFGKGDMALLWSFFIVNVSFYIIRMIFFFPNISPYTINHESILFKTIRFFT